MQAEERERLVQSYNRPDFNAVACMAKCTAGLAIVTLIAIIGQSGERPDQQSVALKASATAAAQAGTEAREGMIRARSVETAAQSVQRAY